MPSSRHSAAYGIVGTSELGRDVNTPEGRLDYAGLHLDELKDHPDEVFRFIWDNARALDLRTEFYLSVESVVPARRVGPDGFVVYESAASYVQLLDGSAAELVQLAASQGGSLQLPDGLDPATRVQIQGGGALIFDEFGRAKFHQRKSMFDWDRQSLRLASLFARRVRDTQDRIGFSVGGPAGSQFRLLHVPADVESDRW